MSSMFSRRKRRWSKAIFPMVPKSRPKRRSSTSPEYASLSFIFSFFIFSLFSYFHIFIFSYFHIYFHIYSFFHFFIFSFFQVRFERNHYGMNEIPSLLR